MNQLMTAGADDEDTPACRVVGAGAQFMGKNGHLYAPGICAQSVGARRISLQIAAIPPGAWGKTHKHDSHESAIYVLSGDAGMWHGEKLEHHLVAHAGAFVYVPAGIPHLPYNLSDDDYCVALVARTDPNDRESLVLLPGLDREHRTRAWRGCGTACPTRPVLSPCCHRAA